MNWLKKSSSRASSSSAPSLTSSSSPSVYLKRLGKIPPPISSGSDPSVCLDVFRNHWKQVWNILQPVEPSPVEKMCDEVETVLHNVEQMMNLLIAEESDCGMPGQILHYLLEHDVMEKFGVWCSAITDYAERLLVERLKFYERLISQCKQLVLIHKPIIQPLVDLLTAAAHYLEQYCSADLQRHMILLLHQLCLSISQQTLILHSFFQSRADHGSAKFLIFSLLIPHVHSEETAGQLARDALLLIMALSARNDSVGQYIAHNSDFCPVLAAGLSGLYSGLPRKLTQTGGEWHHLTDEDCAGIPELQMFLNSLNFCNAVTQVAHPLVRDQLISFIYNGFLVPVMGPALHQNSRDEIVAATAYLELFMRKITEPVLLKAFLKFILSAKCDDDFILDSLITRVNSSSPLCVMSLSLFKTMIDLNCEDVMFQLIFKYLIPCSHVMVSQRRAVKELDLYSKSARKFLCLRPVCCTCLNDEAKSTLWSGDSAENSEGLTSYSSMFSNSYMDYLEDARTRIRDCARSCRHWSVPYNGDNPPHYSTTSHWSFDASRSYSDSVFERSRCSDLSKSQLTGSGVSVVSVHDDDTPADLSTAGSTRPSDNESYDKDRSISDTCAIDASRKPDVRVLDMSEVGDISDIIDASVISGESLLDDSFMESREKQRLTSSAYDCDDSKSDIDISQCDNLETFMQYLNTVDVSLSSVASSTPSLTDDDRDIESSIREIDSMLNDIGSLGRTFTEPTLDPSVCTAVEPRGAAETDLVLTSVNQRLREKTVRNGNDSSFIDITSVPDHKLVVTLSEKNNVLDATSFIVIDSPKVSSKEDCEQGVETSGSVTPTNDLSPNTTDDQTVEIIHNHAPRPSDAPSRTHVNNDLEMTPEGDKRFPINSFSLKPYQVVLDDSITSLGNSSTRSISLLRPDLSEPPCIGPFLSALFAKLEVMMHNGLYVNLLLTDLISRIACYPQPLLRSFLLSHNLVFQPSVKSLVQVLGSVRQRVDGYLNSIGNVDQLLMQARNTLIWHEHVYLLEVEKVAMGTVGEYSENVASLGAGKPKKSVSLADLSSRAEKHKTTFAERLFKKSPNRQRNKHWTPPRTDGVVLKAMSSGKGYLYRNVQAESPTLTKNQRDPPATINAVYCVLILEEFVKELAALAQEHSVLPLDDGYHSN